MLFSIANRLHVGGFIAIQVPATFHSRMCYPYAESLVVPPFDLGSSPHIPYDLYYSAGYRESGPLDLVMNCTISILHFSLFM
jgi:hypothetical protein